MFGKFFFIKFLSYLNIKSILHGAKLNFELKLEKLLHYQMTIK